MASRAFILGILVACISISVCSVDSSTWQSRYKRLIHRYLSNPKARGSMVSRPGRTWLCRRGNKVAVCGASRTYQGRRGYRFQRRSRLPPRSMTISRTFGRDYQCTNSTCFRGRCVSGRCACYKGWMGQRCGLDINECARKTHVCQHKCINKRGRYACACRPGYKPLHGGRVCVTVKANSIRVARPAAIRTKASWNGRPRSAFYVGRSSYRNFTSPYMKTIQRRPRLYFRSRNKAQTCKKGCRYRCTHNGGVERCYCPKGFSLAPNGISCIDINECLDASNSQCPANQECVNKYGGYTCKCRTGYVMIHTLYGKHCEDANECLNGDNQCGITATCVNTVGSYSCECENGLLKATNNLDCVSKDIVAIPRLMKDPAVDDIQ